LDNDGIYLHTSYHGSGMEVSKGTNEKSVYQTYCNGTAGRGAIMNIVEAVSILAGSIILLGLFLPIAYEGVKTKSTTKQNRVSVLNDKWQKLTVSAR
jgi:hypothetical protein